MAFGFMAACSFGGGRVAEPLSVAPTRPPIATHVPRAEARLPAKCPGETARERWAQAGHVPGVPARRDPLAGHPERSRCPQSGASPRRGREARRLLSDGV